MGSFSCKECESLSCSLLKQCSEEWLDYIDEIKSCFKVRKSNVIFHEDNDTEGVYFIQKGKVKVFKTGVNGREQIIRLSKSGDILGHRGWKRNIMPISATALEDCKICFVNEAGFEKVLKQNHKLTYDLMMFYADELYSSEIKARNLAQMNVMELVADSLLYLYKVYGNNEEGYIDVILSRQEIADLSGTTKEQVSKYLSEFSKEGIIEINKHAIKLVNIDGLDKIRSRYFEKNLHHL